MQPTHFFLRAAAPLMLLAALCIPQGAASQDYPSRSITFVIPSSAGGSPDTIGRVIAQKLSESLRQPVVVENVAGASGIIGTEKVARAKPDGYTVLYGFNQLVTMNPHLFTRLPYSAENDFEPVVLVMRLGYVWVAAPSFPASSVDEWLRIAKARPGKLTFASNGPGSAAHLGGELVNQLAGVDMLHVPYRSNGVPPDLLSGLVDVKIEPSSLAVPMIRSGHLKALAVTGTQRIAALPGVPALSETLPGYDITGWQAVWVPAGTPREVVAKLNAEINRIIALPEMQSRFAQIAAEGVGGAPSVLTETTRNESKMWRELLRARNIKPES